MSIILLSAALMIVLYQKTFANRVYVISSVNNKRYLVRDNNSKESADRLAKLVQKKNMLCQYIKRHKKYKNHNGVKRLLERQDVEIEEKSLEYDNQAAYSINKGERIGICLRNNRGQYEDGNTMFFVLMHELAHIMSRKYAHDEEFWNNFAILIEVAIEAKLYKYKEYSKDVTTFCGHVISHTPYKR